MHDAMRLALVRTQTGEIVYERPDANPAAGTDPGLAWWPVVESTVGAGPVASVAVSVVATPVVVDGLQFPGQVARVTTLRAKSAQEITDEKAAAVSSNLGVTPQGRAIKQLFEAVFFLAKQSNPGLTLPQFKTAVEGLNAIPEQAFFDWIAGKL
jgi:hypothetical protein